MKSLRKRPEPELREWRRARLIQAGFEPGLATSLGFDARIDLHDLLGLVDRGCPPHLAARILAPLDEEPAG
jgi:hypothetical protein